MYDDEEGFKPGDLINNDNDNSMYMMPNNNYQNNYSQQGNFQQNNYNQQGNFQQSNYNQQGNFQQNNYNQQGNFQQNNFNQQGNFQQNNYSQQGNFQQNNFNQQGNYNNVNNNNSSYTSTNKFDFKQLLSNKKVIIGAGVALVVVIIILILVISFLPKKKVYTTINGDEYRKYCYKTSDIVEGGIGHSFGIYIKKCEMLGNKNATCVTTQDEFKCPNEEVANQKYLELKEKYPIESTELGFDTTVIKKGNTVYITAWTAYQSDERTVIKEFKKEYICD